jgi:hypothetical protein
MYTFNNWHFILTKSASSFPSKATVCGWARITASPLLPLNTPITLSQRKQTQWHVSFTKILKSTGP